jgi:zinc protease
LLRRGTKTKSRQQIEDTLSQLKAQIVPSSGAGSLGFTVVARREVLPQVLDLLTEILREPLFPESEFEVLKNQSREGLERSKTEPMPLAQRALLRTLFPYPDGDVRKIPTIEESLENNKKLTLEAVKKLYSEQLGAEDVELVAVGDFDPGQVKAFLEKLTNNWTAKTPYKRIESKAFPELQGSRKLINTPDKANAFYLAGFSLALRDDHPDSTTLELANFLLGGGTLSSRLGNRVRQKEGLAYGVNSSLSIDNQDYLARWLILASCNPAAMPKAEKAIQEEVEKMVNEGFTPVEITEGRKALLAEAINARSSDSGIAAILSDSLEARRGVDFYVAQEKKLGILDPAEVNKVIKEYFSPKKMVIIEAGDFEKKK